MSGKSHVSCSAQLVEDICLHKMADRLYSNLQAECDTHISAQLARLASDHTMDPVLFLGKVCKYTWSVSGMGN